ncbi:MAG: glutamate 5-kinase [Proteobacteria bacterium SG_bin7]|nr:MAG: glutamate 5-kinase [Proteobacteria bacterium SG_bin7]
MRQRRWIVKAGSRMVCTGGLLLIRTWMQQIQILRKKHNIEVIWVTSGAIGTAVTRMNFNKRKRTLQEKQALSAIGQPLVMDQYNIALHAVGLMGSQVLLTADDMKHSDRKKNLQNTLKELLRWKIVPVLNENDAVATEEIQFGDNDSLASRVAVMMAAEKLILLTDVDGLYTANPQKVSYATLIPYLKHVTIKEKKMADGKNTSKFGVGGMYSKLLAAERAGKDGIITHLVRGDVPNNLLEIASGRSIGTQIGGLYRP